MTWMYSYGSSDHLPLFMSTKCCMHGENVTDCFNTSKPHIKWSKLSDSDLNKYQNCTDRCLKSCLAEVNVLTCNDQSCRNVDHHRKIDDLYDTIVNSLTQSSRGFLKHHHHVNKQKFGGNDLCRDSYKQEREAFLLWRGCG